MGFQNKYNKIFKFTYANPSGHTSQKITQIKTTLVSMLPLSYEAAVSSTSGMSSSTHVSTMWLSSLSSGFLYFSRAGKNVFHQMECITWVIVFWRSYEFEKDHYLPLNRPQNLCTLFGQELNLTLKSDMRNQACWKIFFLLLFLAYTHTALRKIHAICSFDSFHPFRCLSWPLFAICTPFTHLLNSLGCVPHGKGKK